MPITLTSAPPVLGPHCQCRRSCGGSCLPAAIASAARTAGKRAGARARTRWRAKRKPRTRPGVCAPVHQRPLLARQPPSRRTPPAPVRASLAAHTTGSAVRRRARHRGLRATRAAPCCVTQRRRRRWGRARCASTPAVPAARFRPPCTRAARGKASRGRAACATPTPRARATRPRAGLRTNVDAAFPAVHALHAQLPPSSPCPPRPRCRCPHLYPRPRPRSVLFIRPLAAVAVVRRRRCALVDPACVRARPGCRL